MKKKNIVKVVLGVFAVGLLVGGIVLTDMHTMIDPDVGVKLFTTLIGR